jgi:UDP-glucose 4-epimerase/UDP-glucuronate decarboxylase
MGAEQTRAFCHVKDAVEATRLIMEASRETSLIVHIGNDREETRISDLAARLLKLADRNVAIVPAPAPRGSVPRRLPSLNLLRQMTGFEPTVTIEEGLKDTFEWYRRILTG